MTTGDMGEYMSKWLKDRNNQIMLVIIFLMSSLVIRLFSLTIVQGEEWRNASDNIRVKQIYTSAPRGEIRDRYGRVLAGNKPSFVVQIIRNNLVDEQINEEAIKLLSILEKNGDKYTDNFPILIEGDEFVYTYQKNIEKWLESQGMPLDFTAEEAFLELRNRHNISEDLDRYEAQLELQSIYNIFPPISVKAMDYLQNLEKNIFLGKYNLETDISAENAFESFKKIFEIDGSYSSIEARKIMVIRNELDSQGYRKFNPVELAVDISEQTIIELEERSRELPGIEVVVEPVRYYPYGTLAAHILGYLGKISESEKELYVNELGYLPSDIIGKEGIEKVFESHLKGVDGVKHVEVDAFGRLIKTIEESSPQKGKNIYLTIDAKLQSVAEAALIQALKEIQAGGSFKSKWGDYKYSDSFQNAKSGAVVALDVKTGDVLAMASYPAYDPNMFALGISEENWNSLQDKNPRDPLSPLPLFNIAARTAVQPGSAFKMLVGLTALEHGLDAYQKYYDGGYVKLGDRTFGCSLWNSSRASHGYVNLMEAIEVSCNYYFYDVMSNYDYSRKAAIPINMKIDDVMELASKFGLGNKTGIEISEVATGVPSEEKKIAVTKRNLKSRLKNNANYYFEPEIASDEKLLEDSINTILSWTEENPSRGELVQRLSKTGIQSERLYELTDIIKYSYFNMATWSVGDTLNLSIGQGEHAYTPLQMANFIATISNGGYKHKLSVVKGIEGTDLEIKEEDKALEYKIDVDPQNIEYIKMGMNRVTSGSRGTARGVFGNFPIEAGGKTGTAERSGKIQPADEVEYIKRYLKWINPKLSFQQVEEEMLRLMKDNPAKYTSKTSAVRAAVINLSEGKVTEKSLDVYKDDYENFAWFVGFAPYDEPEIAVAVLIFQGGHGGYAAPVAREIFAEYLGLNNEYQELDLESYLTR